MTTLEKAAQPATQLDTTQEPVWPLEGSESNLTVLVLAGSRSRSSRIH